MSMRLCGNLQAKFLLYCHGLTIPKQPWQMGFCMYIDPPGELRRNPKGHNLAAKSLGHATSRGAASELKCFPCLVFF